MSIHSLPTELLQRIFWMSIPPRIEFLDGVDYRTRHQTLRALALVHPNWTPIAQEILVREVCLNEGDEGMARKARGIVKLSHKFRTKVLVVGGNLEVLLGVGRNGAWDDVTYLEHDLTADEDFKVDIDLYTRFPKLEGLYVESAHFCFPPSLRNPVPFSNLRRLALWDALSEDRRGLRHLLAPSLLPRLSHLALNVQEADVPWDELLQPILPQLETLVFSIGTLGEHRNCLSEETLLKGFSLNGLEHFGYEVADHGQLEALLFSQGLNLDLASLHLWIDRGAWCDDPVLWCRFRQVVDGEVDSMRAKRFVVYGDEPSFSGYVLGAGAFSNIEWRHSEDIDFRFFDGS